MCVDLNFVMPFFFRYNNVYMCVSFGTTYSKIRRQYVYFCVTPFFKLRKPQNLLSVMFSKNVLD